MKRNYILLAGAAMVAALAGAFVLWTPISEKNVEQPSYLQKAGGEVLLPPASREEILRRVLYGADGFTRLRLVVYFVNGDTGVTVYHPDGSLVVYRYHPSDREIDWKAQTLSEQGAKSVINYTSDGHTVATEKHWDETGTLRRVGLRAPGGEFQVDAFYEDGVKLAEHSTFDKKGLLQSQLTYWENGNKKTILKQTGGASAMEWESYYPDGKKAGYRKGDIWNERGEYYFEDGITVRMKYSKETSWYYYSAVSKVIVQYNNRDGSLAQTRTYQQNQLTVENVKNGNVPAFTQEWKMIDPKREPANRFVIGNYTLNGVKVSRFNGLDNVEFIVKEGRVVEYRFVRKVQNVEERVTQLLRADGTVEKEIKVSQSGRTERDFTGDTGGRVIVPAAYLAGGYENPPAVPQDVNPSRGYYP